MFSLIFLSSLGLANELNIDSRTALVGMFFPSNAESVQQAESIPDILLQHFAINITSIFPNNGETFNKLSHFMGTNPVVQYALQPVLIIGVVFHFVMGFILELKNTNS